MASVALRHPCGFSGVGNVQLHVPFRFLVSSLTHLSLFHPPNCHLSCSSMCTQQHSFIKGGADCRRLHVRPAALHSNVNSPTPQDDDVILLDVEGMTCSGCTASVKRILESLESIASLERLEHEKGIILSHDTFTCSQCIKKKGGTFADFCGHYVSEDSSLFGPQVSGASVNLDTKGAVVWVVPGARTSKDWQQDLGKILANHLTNCGFKSTVSHA